MKDLLSKEHYCQDVHTILIKSSGYRPPPPTTPPPLYGLPPSIILHKGMGLTMKTH